MAGHNSIVQWLIYQLNTNQHGNQAWLLCDCDCWLLYGAAVCMSYEQADTSQNPPPILASANSQVENLYRLMDLSL